MNKPWLYHFVPEIDQNRQLRDVKNLWSSRFESMPGRPDRLGKDQKIQIAVCSRPVEERRQPVLCVHLTRFHRCCSEWCPFLSKCCDSRWGVRQLRRIRPKSHPAGVRRCRNQCWRPNNVEHIVDPMRFVGACQNIKRADAIVDWRCTKRSQGIMLRRRSSAVRLHSR
jgi:hypothetical protein